MKYIAAGAYQGLVEHFGEAMVTKMQANAYKGGWRDDSVYDILQRLDGARDEVMVLLHQRGVQPGVNQTVQEDVVDEIRKECADIANFAMMLVDILAQKNPVISKESFAAPAAPAGVCASGLATPPPLLD